MGGPGQAGKFGENTGQNQRGKESVIEAREWAQSLGTQVGQGEETPDRKTGFLAREQSPTGQEGGQRALIASHVHPHSRRFHPESPLTPGGRGGSAGQLRCCPLGTRVKQGCRQGKGVLLCIGSGLLSPDTSIPLQPSFKASLPGHPSQTGSQGLEGPMRALVEEGVWMCTSLHIMDKLKNPI